MKFYIFGNTNDKKNFVISSKKAVYSSENLNEALNKYEEYVDRASYSNCYFVADFEVYRNSKMFGSISLGKDTDLNLPFFIIGEWHLGETDKNNCIRKDHTIIKKRGFTHEFENNLVAIKEFIFCVENNIDCEFSIIYSKIFDLNCKSVNRQFVRKISSRADVIRSRGNSIKKFKLNSPDWYFHPVNSKREFKTYVIPPHTNESAYYNSIKNIKVIPLK